MLNMEYGSIESKYNHMGSLLMKITLISVLPNYLPTDKEDIIAIKQPNKLLQNCQWLSFFFVSLEANLYDSFLSHILGSKSLFYCHLQLELDVLRITISKLMQN